MTLEAEEFLKQYKELNKKAEMYREEYEAECQTIDAIRSALSGDGMPHGTGTSNPTEAEAVKLAAYAEKYAHAAEEAERMKQVIFDMIMTVPGIEGKVLKERYIDLEDNGELRKFWKIEEDLSICESGVYKAHRRGLQIIAEKIK